MTTIEKLEKALEVSKLIFQTTNPSYCNGCSDIVCLSNEQLNLLKEAIEELKENECEHPWYSVIGDGELKPAKCLKCGKNL